MKNFKNSKIYKIISPESELCYVGSTTCDLIKRLDEHINNFNSNGTCSSKQILKYPDYKIELIKNYSCDNQNELSLEERKHILNNKVVNKQLPLRTPKEYRQTFREKLNKKSKEYYLENLDALTELKATFLPCELCNGWYTYSHKARHQICCKKKMCLKEKKHVKENTG